MHWALRKELSLEGPSGHLQPCPEQQEQEFQASSALAALHASVLLVKDDGLWGANPKAKG